MIAVGLICISKRPNRLLEILQRAENPGSGESVAAVRIHRTLRANGFLPANRTGCTGCTRRKGNGADAPGTTGSRLWSRSADTDHPIPTTEAFGNAVGPVSDSYPLVESGKFQLLDGTAYHWCCVRPVDSLPACCFFNVVRRRDASPNGRPVAGSLPGTGRRMSSDC